MTKTKKWFAVTTWNAERLSKWVVLNRINGHLIGIVFRLPDGQTSAGKKTYHALSIGRYRREKVK